MLKCNYHLRWRPDYTIWWRDRCQCQRWGDREGFTWRTWKDFERLPFDPQDGSIYNEGPMMMMMMRGHVEFFCASYLVMPYSHTLTPYKNWGGIPTHSNQIEWQLLLQYYLKPAINSKISNSYFQNTFQNSDKGATVIIFSPMPTYAFSSFKLQLLLEEA